MRRNIYCLLFISCLLTGFSQNKNYIKITYVSCFSTFETWIDDKNYNIIEGRDSIFIYNKINIKELKTLFKLSKSETAINRIDYRIKIEIYCNNKKNETYFFDNKGFYTTNKGVIYMTNRVLLDKIKKLVPNINCW